MATAITYGHWQDGLSGFPTALRHLIVSGDARSVCDVGGGAAPALSIDEVADLRLEYTLLDISTAELDKASDKYRKINADVGAVNLGRLVPDRFDLVFSHMLAEHVKEPKQFHRNVFELLQPGGTAVHFMPTLWDPAFILNRILPEQLTAKLLAKLQPGRRLGFDQAKFPAYYRWCRGPSRGQLRRFERLGYEVVAVNAYFGTGYPERVPGISKLFELATSTLIRHPAPALTSYSMIVLRKPRKLNTV